MNKMLWQATFKPELTASREVAKHVLPYFESDKHMSVRLSCDEMLTNIVMYSGATSIEVQAIGQEDQILIRLTDDGIPYDPVTAEPIERDFDELDQGGMGISLVKHACDGMDYARIGDKNVLTLHFKTA